MFPITLEKKIIKCVCFIQQYLDCSISCLNDYKLKRFIMNCYRYQMVRSITSHIDVINLYMYNKKKLKNLNKLVKGKDFTNVVITCVLSHFQLVCT